MDLMKPAGSLKFGDVCGFISTCAEQNIQVNCTAVERPGINIRGVRELAFSLGASSFKTYPYFP
jgi:hypothetical protein